MEAAGAIEMRGHIRPFRRVIACLLIGVTASVAVAWACWMWPPNSQRFSINPQREQPDWLRSTHNTRLMTSELVHGRSSFGALMGSYSLVDVGARLLAEPHFVLRTSFPDVESHLRARAYANVESDIRARYSESEWYERYTSPPVDIGYAGWPLYCLSREDAWTRDPATRTLLFPPTSDWLTNREGYQMPIRPIPLGLALNTLFYAFIAAVPILLVPALRRRHRRLRGRCVACGYTLAGLSTCPECGVAASPRVLPA